MRQSFKAKINDAMNPFLPKYGLVSFQVTGQMCPLLHTIVSLTTNFVIWIPYFGCISYSGM